MTTITFDTLEYSKALQEAGMPQQQAGAMAKVQNKALQDMVRTQELATKADLAETKHEILKETLI